MKFNLCAIGHLMYYEDMSKGFVFIWVVLGVLIAGAVLFVPIPKNSMCPASMDVDCPMEFGPSLFEKLITKKESSSQVACTMEAKLCSDGSSVGRDGPKCEFKKCPESSETINWKTYNSKYGYTVKYPNEWGIKMEEWEEGSISYGFVPDEDEAIIRFSEPNQPPHGGQPYGVLVYLKNPKDNPTNLTSAQWVDRFVGTEPYSGSVISTKDLFVQNIKGTLVTTESLGSMDMFYFPYKGKMYQLNGNYFTTKDSNVPDYKNIYNYPEVFRKIISTVELID